MVVFWSCFREFVRAQKIEDLTESKKILAEVFQITSRFVSGRGEKMGLGVLKWIVERAVYFEMND